MASSLPTWTGQLSWSFSGSTLIEVFSVQIYQVWNSNRLEKFIYNYRTKLVVSGLNVGMIALL